MSGADDSGYGAGAAERGHEHDYALAGVSAAASGPGVLCRCGALSPDRPMTACPVCGGRADLFGCLDVQRHPASGGDLDILIAASGGPG
jgi:hypothetical protein